MQACTPAMCGGSLRLAVCCGDQTPDRTRVDRLTFAPLTWTPPNGHARHIPPPPSDVAAVERLAQIRVRLGK
jgi:hypothetical protein